MATIIKGTTKKGQNMMANAKNFEGYTLNEVYSKYSPAKFHAFYDCVLKAQAEGGKNFHISSHNTFGFSVAWEIEQGVRIETPKNSYLVLFPEFCN